VNVWNNNSYSIIRDMDVIFDGDQASAVSVQLSQQRGLNEIVLPAPREVKSTITLRARTKTIREGKNANLVGIDNVQFLRAATPEGAMYLDSVGGLVALPRGNGGWFINQVKFMDEEPNPQNVARKRTLLNGILQNMGVGAADRLGVPGVNLRYVPVSLMDYANQYRDRSWQSQDVWFGGNADLTALRTGDNGELTLADVDYQLVRFTTAPKQDSIMLGKNAPKGLPDAVRGIQVGRKADTLFFLHTANVLQPVTDAERARIGARRDAFTMPVVMNYTLKYADGQTLSVPVTLEKGVHHWLQANPLPLEAAQVAWTQRISGAEQATLYSMKFDNPRPDVVIESIDVEVASDRAVPAVLAITTAEIIGGR
jgi:hypothetical protein